MKTEIDEILELVVKDLINSNTNDLKRCLACSELLPLPSYYSKGKDRLDANCKICVGKRKAQKYKKGKMFKARKVSLESVQLELIPIIQ